MRKTRSKMCLSLRASKKRLASVSVGSCGSGQAYNNVHFPLFLDTGLTLLANLASHHVLQRREILAFLAGRSEDGTTAGVVASNLFAGVLHCHLVHRHVAIFRRAPSLSVGPLLSVAPANLATACWNDYVAVVGRAVGNELHHLLAHRLHRPSRRHHLRHGVRAVAHLTTRW